jgi:Icc-related predicted phosphoesterase
MRILASTDEHGSQPVYEWLLNLAREQEVDTIVATLRPAAQREYVERHQSEGADVVEEI